MEPTFKPVFHSPWRILVILAIWGLMWIMTLLPPLGTRPEPPLVVIQNATPCLIQNGQQIALDGFVSGTPQFICGDMTTDKSPIHLTLLVQSPDNLWKSVYVTDNHFKSGAISFSIDPPLPPGQYRARIMYARTTFADIYFDVSE